MLWGMAFHKDSLGISPYSVRMRENADQNNSEYGPFSRSGIYCGMTFLNPSNFLKI